MPSERSVSSSDGSCYSSVRSNFLIKSENICKYFLCTFTRGVYENVGTQCTVFRMSIITAYRNMLEIQRNRERRSEDS